MHVFGLGYVVLEEGIQKKKVTIQGFSGSPQCGKIMLLETRVVIFSAGVMAHRVFYSSGSSHMWAWVLRR